MKRGVLVILLAACLSTVLAVAPSGVSEEPGRLIVGLEDGFDEEIPNLLESWGAADIRLPPNAPFAAVTVPDVDAFTEQALGHEAVRYVETDHPVYPEQNLSWPFGDPIDEHWNLQWGPEAIHAPEAWATTLGDREIVYAVVDTGVDSSHTELQLNTWRNLEEIPNDGIDNDDNGYADDVAGWNCVHDNNNPADYSYHGTHVAGIAGATTNNHFGIAGVAQISVMPLRALGGSITSDAAECIRYAADNGAHVIGMSWWAPDSTTIREAITYAWDQGSLLTKSAGNQYGRGVTFPGYLDEVIATSALSAPDTLASFSSVGPEVEVTAPGASIYSLSPGGGLQGAYRSLSGTSMAQPHTAGVAGLIWSANPDLTNHEVRTILQETADDLGQPGRDPQFGYGRINAEAAVVAAQETL